MFNRIVLAAVSLVCVSSEALAQTAPAELNPTFAWRIEFGGRDQPLHPSLRLGLVQTLGPISDARPELVSLNFTPKQLLANIAGVPLMQHKFRLAQQEEAAPTAPVEESAWYTNKWVLGVGAVVAAGGVAVLAASGDGGNQGGSASASSGGSRLSTNDDGAFCVDTSMPDTCLPPIPGVSYAPSSYGAVTIHLDGDATYMGDLFLR